MTFDDELKLIDFTTTENEMGDVISTETFTTILCDVESVTRSEHYAAAANGMVPEVVFIVNKYDYNGQRRVEHDGKRYEVIRHFTKKKAKNISEMDNLELVCQGVIE